MTTKKAFLTGHADLEGAFPQRPCSSGSSGS
jgi:hypothetical protein